MSDEPNQQQSQNKSPERLPLPEPSEQRIIELPATMTPTPARVVDVYGVETVYGPAVSVVFKTDGDFESRYTVPQEATNANKTARLFDACDAWEKNPDPDGEKIVVFQNLMDCEVLLVFVDHETKRGTMSVKIDSVLGTVKETPKKPKGKGGKK